MRGKLFFSLEEVLKGGKEGGRERGIVMEMDLKICNAFMATL